MKMLLSLLLVALSTAPAFANEACVNWTKSSVGQVYHNGKFSIYLRSAPTKALDAQETCDELLNTQKLCIKGSLADAAPYLSVVLGMTNPESYDIEHQDSSVIVLQGKAALNLSGPTSCEQDNGYDPCAANPPIQPVCTDNGCYYPAPATPPKTLETRVYEVCS